MRDRERMNLSQSGTYFQPRFNPSSMAGPFERHDRNSTKPNSNEKIRVRRNTALGVVFTTKLIESGGTTTEIPITLSWNPQTMLYGCNTGMIVRNEESALAHDRLHALVACEVGKEVADQMVPGFSPDCRTFIQSVEIPVQVKDEGRCLLDRISQIKHPAIRKQGHYTKGQSMKLNGSQVSFQIYDKSLESGVRCADSKDKVIRFELKLQREKFSKYLPDKVGEGDRVSAFDVESLYEAFRAFTKDISGYFKVLREGNIGKAASFIVAVHREFGPPLDALLELYGLDSKNTEMTMRGVTREVSALLEKSVSQIAFEDLFPEEFPERVAVSGSKNLKALDAVNQEVLRWKLPVVPSPERVEYFSSIRTFSEPKIQR